MLHRRRLIARDYPFGLSFAAQHPPSLCRRMDFHERRGVVGRRPIPGLSGSAVVGFRGLQLRRRHSLISERVRLKLAATDTHRTNQLRGISPGPLGWLQREGKVLRFWCRFEGHTGLCTIRSWHKSRTTLGGAGRAPASLQLSLVLAVRPWTLCSRVRQQRDGSPAFYPPAVITDYCFERPHVHDQRDQKARFFRCTQ
jgi:hypothetical protein